MTRIVRRTTAAMPMTTNTPTVTRRARARAIDTRSGSTHASNLRARVYHDEPRTRKSSRSEAPMRSARPANREAPPSRLCPTPRRPGAGREQGRSRLARSRGRPMVILMRRIITVNNDFSEEQWGRSRATNPSPDPTAGLAFLLDAGGRTPPPGSRTAGPLALTAAARRHPPGINQADGLSQQALGETLGVFPSRLVGAAGRTRKARAGRAAGPPHGPALLRAVLDRGGREASSRSAASRASTRKPSAPPSTSRSGRSSRGFSADRGRAGFTPASIRAIADSAVREPRNRQGRGSGRFKEGESLGMPISRPMPSIVRSGP